MKAAMWGVGLCVLGLFGLVLINLFGNITVTNQFNYTTMKNAVQAAMYDSLDIAHYRAGFCLCTTDGSKINQDKINTFTDKKQYTFRDIVNDKCVNANGEEANNCVALYGEYRLDTAKFEENLKKRFENVLTNNKSYSYIMKEIVEYPPKVGVKIVSYDTEYSPTDKESGGYSIVNEMDAIIETYGKSHCYYTVANGEYQYQFGSESEFTGTNWQQTSSNISPEKCRNACFKHSDGNLYWEFAGTATGEEQVGLDKEDCKNNSTPTTSEKYYCYRSKEKNSDGYYKYEWRKEGIYSDWTNKDTKNVLKKDCRNACYKKSDGTLYWGFADTATGTEQTNITKPSDCVESVSVNDKCNWHYYNPQTVCYSYKEEQKQVGVNESCPSGYVFSGYSNEAYDRAYNATGNNSNNGRKKICVKKTQTTKAYSDLGNTGKSELGKFTTKAKAVEQCKEDARAFCISKGHVGVSSTNCKGVKDYKITGQNSSGKTVVWTIPNQEKQPSCPFYKCTSINCLG